MESEHVTSMKDIERMDIKNSLKASLRWFKDESYMIQLGSAFDAFDASISDDWSAVLKYDDRLMCLGYVKVPDIITSYHVHDKRTLKLAIRNAIHTLCKEIHKYSAC